MNQFSDLLKEGRKREGLSQEKVGELLGISQEGYGLYERGKREPDFETMKNLVKLFKIEKEFINLFLEQSVVSREKIEIPVNLAAILDDLSKRLGDVETTLRLMQGDDLPLPVGDDKNPHGDNGGKKVHKISQTGKAGKKSG